MIIEIKEDGTWFHGSNIKFDVLKDKKIVIERR